MLRLIILIIAMMVLGVGCASNMKVSSDICREGALRAYQDEDFYVECQHKITHEFVGNVPQTYVLQEESTPRGPNPIGFYGKEIVSGSK